MAASGVPEEVFRIEVPKIAFTNPNLYAIKVMGDGSCFFHSVLRGFNLSYISAASSAERKRLAILVRQATADSLEEKNPTTGKTEYESMGGGCYKDYNEAVKDVDGDKYSLAAMKRELLSSTPVDHAYTEILSNYLDLDIYLISSQTGDIYATGTDFNLYYKDRRSIVILYSPGHYDVVGIKRMSPDREDTIFDTLFAPTHELIAALRKRYKDITNR